MAGQLMRKRLRNAAIPAADSANRATDQDFRRFSSDLTGIPDIDQHPVMNLIIDPGSKVRGIITSSR
jgi:hypothetical protein